LPKIPTKLKSRIAFSEIQLVLKACLASGILKISSDFRFGIRKPFHPSPAAYAMHAKTGPGLIIINISKSLKTNFWQKLKNENFPGPHKTEIHCHICQLCKTLCAPTMFSYAKLDSIDWWWWIWRFSLKSINFRFDQWSVYGT
jgi:hypothetical protein